MIDPAVALLAGVIVGSVIVLLAFYFIARR